MWKVLHSRWTVVLQLEWSVLQWTFVEGTAQQVDSFIVAWMESITVNIRWKVLHSRWTVELQLEWSVLQWTLCGRYFRASGQLYCSLKGVCYSKHYHEETSQQVDSCIVAWMECVTVNIMWKILQSRWAVKMQMWMECVTVNIMWNVLHSRCTEELQLEWGVFQWTLGGRYCKVGGQWYCRLNEVYWSKHYVEDTAQQVNSAFAASNEFITVNFMWKLLQGGWTVVL